MSDYTLVQRLRGQGVVLCLQANGRDVIVHGHIGANAHTMACYSGEILNELRAEHINGRVIASAMKLEDIDVWISCEHSWPVGDDIPQYLACEKCGFLL